MSFAPLNELLAKIISATSDIGHYVEDCIEYEWAIETRQESLKALEDFQAQCIALIAEHDAGEYHLDRRHAAAKLLGLVRTMAVPTKENTL